MAEDGDADGDKARRRGEADEQDMIEARLFRSNLSSETLSKAAPALWTSWRKGSKTVLLTCSATTLKSCTGTAKVHVQELVELASRHHDRNLEVVVFMKTELKTASKVASSEQTHESVRVVAHDKKLAAALGRCSEYGARKAWCSDFDTYFLVDSNGLLAGRFEDVFPGEFEAAIAALLLLL